MLLRNRKEDLFCNTIKLLIQERKEVFFISVIELKPYLSPIKNEISEILLKDTIKNQNKSLCDPVLVRYKISSRSYIS